MPPSLDYLCKESTVNMGLSGSAYTISETEAIIQFCDNAIKLAKKLARFRISNH